MLSRLTRPSTGRVSQPQRARVAEVVRSYPKVQILTVADYFDGLRPDLPDTSETLKKAPRIKREKGKEGELPLT